MNFNWRVLRLLSRDCRAVTTLEYALIAGIIVTTVAIGFNSFTSAFDTQVSSLGNNL